MNNTYQIESILRRALALCLFVSVFSCASAQHASLGTNISNALDVDQHMTAIVTDGAENYFQIQANHLPATVYYWPDTAFGPIPMLVEVKAVDDTLPAKMVSEGCHMGWKWELAEAADEENARYFYFSAHENNAIAEFFPHTCDNTSSDTTAIACDSLFWNGEWRKESGDYEYHTTNAAGCDSTAILHLTIHKAVMVQLPDTAVCELEIEGYEYIWSDPVKGDTTIRHSGTYTRHFQTAFGCDSAVTQTIRFLDMTHGETTITAYDSYTTNIGQTYVTSWENGGPIDYYTNAAGCDSIVDIYLYIRHLQVIDTFPLTVCASELPFVWYGKSYMEGGQYSTDTIHGEAVNKVYMDTVHTVNLTVLPVSAGDTAATACESFEWYGQTYEQSGEYSHTFEGGNIYGCDSVVTLHLTINHANAGDTTVKACEEFTWYGVTYTESAEPTHTFTNIHGCDSIVTLHLTINHANSSEETRTEYESYEWNGVTYTESGDYTFETKNAAGCDSTATLHLTIEERPHVDYTYDTVYFCQGYNTEHEELISETQIRRYRKYRYESPAEWAYRDGLVVATQDHRIQLDLRHVEESLEAYYIGELEPIKKISWIYRKDGETALENLTSAAEPIWKDYGYLTIEVRFICGHVFAETIKAGSTEGVEDIDAADTSVRKILKDGQIYILRGNTKYTIEGLKIEN